MSNYDDVLRFFSNRLKNLDDVEKLSLQSMFVWEENAPEVNIDHYTKIRDKIGAKWMRCGISKIVFYFEELPNMVLKVPVRGHTYLLENNFGDLETVEEKLFDSAVYLDGDEYNWDYCYAEMLLYNSAKRYMVEDFFLPLTFLGTSKKIPVYCQPFVKVSTDGVIVSHGQIKSGRDMGKKTQTEIVLSGRAIAKFVQTHGEKDTERFLKFINSKEIEDLHSQNMGMLDGKVVLIDYGGYRDYIY